MSAARIESGIWQDHLWFPSNVTWTQVDEEGNYPKAFDLLYCFPLALVIILIRLLVEKLFFLPVGLACGIKKTHFEHNSILEKAHLKGCQTESQIQELAAVVQWSERKVQSWFRKRHRLNKTSKTQKFNESGWRCTFYSIMVLYCVNCLWDTPWFWNVIECWTNRASFITPNNFWWYYMIELAFYVSLMISQFVDVQRKDFWQMMLHHIIVILLMLLIWAVNCVRIGSLIMLCHDVGDIPLETTKLFRYLKMKKISEVSFIIFLLTWFISRLIIYPFVLLKTMWNDSPLLLGPIPLYLFNIMLWVIFALHIMWTWMILRIVQSFIVGKPKDVRSDSEEDSTDSSDKKVQ